MYDELNGPAINSPEMLAKEGISPTADHMQKRETRQFKTTYYGERFETSWLGPGALEASHNTCDKEFR